ncbi:probable sodium/potassium/calcium exchanger CG1090 [Galendromus occidentalis]|uniref:Probable sodium/potassium/calcium exchanger CG1090 n=1 Tax=Galendromus occidentalis TaxID=34638 RepID=A0AAJ6QS94_9ACAR|nr:probable sodium/potassium/calcium exchanger CG1090 [Galendromus occidentalis]
MMMLELILAISCALQSLPRFAGAELAAPGDSSPHITLRESNLTELADEGLRIPIGTADIKCLPAAIEEFPRPIVNAEMRARGGILVHITIALCIILIISVACKEYFVPALQQSIDYLRIDPDVAGGTFMAAASSIPALVTSVIGVNVVENDLGLSTALGTGVLNGAGVLAACALLAHRSVVLHAWPLFRSSFFFLLGMVVVMFSLTDGEISWIEASLCLAAYALYVLAMVFNKTLESCFKTWTGIQDSEDKAQDGGETATGDISFQQTAVEMLALNEIVVSELATSVPKELEVAMGAPARNKTPADSMHVAEAPAWEDLSLPQKFSRAVETPVSYILSCLIPDCKKPGSEKFFALTFLLSGASIACSSYALVWMMAIIGFTIGIPDSVLGLTLMSMSVTLPDVMAAVLLVREGFGDMVVCYVLGANIFEVLIGLGLPWFLQTTLIKPGVPIVLQSSGLVYSTGCVLFTVVLVPTLTCATRGRMNKTFGVILLLWYITFMVSSCLYQMNFFTDINPPSCGSSY